MHLFMHVLFGRVLSLFLLQYLLRCLLANILEWCVLTDSCTKWDYSRQCMASLWSSEWWHSSDHHWSVSEHVIGHSCPRWSSQTAATS